MGVGVGKEGRWDDPRQVSVTEVKSEGLQSCAPIIPLCLPLLLPEKRRECGSPGFCGPDSFRAHCTFGMSMPLVTTCL